MQHDKFAVDWMSGDFRPTNFDEMALYPSLRKRLKMYKTTKVFNHLIFVGDTGVGKTTTAKILGSEGFATIEINCAKDNSKTQIEKMEKNTNAITINRKPRLIIMDEFHHIEKKNQTILNVMMEERKEWNRFIFCVNDFTKVAEPIISRCFKLSFDVCAVVGNPPKLQLHSWVDNMDVKEWKEELKRVGKLVAKKGGCDATDAQLDMIAGEDLYCLDTRRFIGALKEQIRMDEWDDDS